MICPKCFSQLVQATHEMQSLGNGYGTDSEYLTWEIKYCKECHEYYLEQYSAMKINLEDVEKIATDSVWLKALIGQDTSDLFILRKD